MKKIFATLLSCFILLIAVGQQAAYWQQQVNYTIDVTLNDKDNTLNGFVKMAYTNNSPDTLHFIWLHLWPNAYKNDRTAFTDQSLENGSTKFYFSDNDERGYINRLDLKVNGATAKTEDHPQHQDIMKLLLPQPLAPGAACMIATPFHVKLPYTFSRSGHDKQAYHITQWYPKPAVYDRKGWHPMPYLDQGEFYSEFGNFDVQITLPAAYKLAATGEEKNAESNSDGTITYHYTQDKVHDFAWFADKTFIVEKDKLQLPSGRTVNVQAFYYPSGAKEWKNAIAMIKRAVLTKTEWLGEYPYNVVTVVDAGKGNGGMEYPTITLLSSGGSEKTLDFVINHEVGHNWFCEILASNERLHPWMDEGMNTYYDNRYARKQYGNTDLEVLQVKSPFLQKRMPSDLMHTLLHTLTAIKKDQPIETPSEKFNFLNYNAVAYTKTGDWMELLEKELGQPLFDSCMKTYYRRWQFRHPYPEDFKQAMEQASGRNLDAVFALQHKKGDINPPAKKDIRFMSFFGAKDTDKHNYIFASPAVGYNFYDKFMIGALLHNYTLPPTKFQFIVAPLYATNSKQFNGLGRLGYSWYPGSNGQKVELAVAGASFSRDSYTDSVNNTTYLRFSKIVPSLKYVFGNKNPRSTMMKSIQWKTFLIREQGILFTRDMVNDIDIITYPTASRYVNQLQFTVENNRVLYPYKGVLQFEQGKGFAKAGFTGNYFFNYAKNGGLDVRLFAGKFFYLGDKTFTKQFETDMYHLNMTGSNGYEDYTYSNYFIGRSEFEGTPSQQIMVKDGAFKVRTDLLSNKVGRTDDWLAAMNFTSTIPNSINPLSILPVKIPLKLFLDIGTYADAWKKDAETGRFVYDAGVQLSLLNVVNIYVPLLYSSIYKDYYRSYVPEKTFLKKISFSIDLQQVSLRKIVPQLSF